MWVLFLYVFWKLGDPFPILSAKHGEQRVLHGQYVALCITVCQPYVQNICIIIMEYVHEIIVWYLVLYWNITLGAAVDILY